MVDGGDESPPFMLEEKKILLKITTFIFFIRTIIQNFDELWPIEQSGRNL